jgi:cytochrome c oxidase subunit 2
MLSSGGAQAAESDAGDPAKGARWYTVCGACHGEHGEGIRALETPRLAGLPASYLFRQLEAFRSGRRGTGPGDSYGQQMVPMAALLPDARAVADVTAYIGTLRATPTTPAPNSAAVERGQQSYRACAACHGTSAEGIELQHAPPLAGQSSVYLIRQLRAFESRTRGGPRADAVAQTMSAAVAILAKTGAEEDTAAYIATLPLAVNETGR